MTRAEALHAARRHALVSLERLLTDLHRIETELAACDLFAPLQPKRKITHDE